MFRAHYLVLTLAFAFCTGIVSAQVPTGTPPFGSFGGGPDTIDLANLNSHIAIPVLHKPGRGTNFTYDLSYDTYVWFRVTSNGTTSWQPVQNWGWRAVTEVVTGYVNYSSTIGSCYDPDLRRRYNYTVYNFQYYHDSLGVSHPLNVTVSTQVPCSFGPPYNSSATVTDGSGLSVTVTAAPSATVTSPDGTVFHPPLQQGTGAGSFTDRNGNQSTADASGHFYDTLSSTTPVLTVAGSGTPTSPTSFAYTAPSGASASYSMKFTAYTVQTKFACSGISEYGPTSNNLVSEIDLPDGSKYSFTYEGTPGVSGNVTGRLASVTLPTGGTITYSYTGGSNGITCADGSAATLTRTTPDGTWTYAQVKGSGAASTTTITDPLGNQTANQFQGIYETQRQVYQGSTTLLLTTNTCYNGATSPCNGTAITLPITNRTVITTLPNNLQSKHFDSFSAFGMPTETDDYDYGSGAPGALLQKTTITYASLGNITAFRHTVSVYNATTQVAQTNYNYDETGVTTTSGTPQHVSVSGSRGNLTSVNYPAGGLTAHFTYYDTGTMNTATDVNGAVTTNSYAGSSCGNSFPTSVSEPLNLSRSMTWNCTGGVPLTATDENSKTVITTYNDPYFWRPNIVADQLGNQTNFSYQPNPVSCCPFMVASILTFNNGNSEASDFQYKDGLGRTYVDQRQQAPGSSTLDSVSYNFDSNGRPNSVSMPCAIGYAATCSTPKTTQTYDALNRPLLTTDGGGGTVSYSYTGNDVLLTIGPAPSGENSKRRQLEYDALGRLTSVCEITGGSGSGACGQNVAQTGFWTKYTYDALNDLTDVTQNAQPGGSQQTRHYNFDAMSRLTSETNPESGTTSYTFDSDTTCGAYAGDLVKRVNAAGVATCTHYDALHRPTFKSYSTGGDCKFFFYDASDGLGYTEGNVKGRLAGAWLGNCSTGNATTSNLGFNYSVRGELLNVYQWSSNSGGWYNSVASYWPSGALNTLQLFTCLTNCTNGANQNAVTPLLTYNVDGEGRPYQVSASSGQNPVTNTAFNPASLPTAVTLGSSDSDAFQYDPNTNRMTQYKFTVNGSSLTGVLGWNANGTLQTQNVTDGFNSADTQNCSYGYDDVTRITSANCGSAAAQTFSYNGDGSGALGNISKSGSPYSFQPTYSSATNRMTSIGSFTPSYDANGNVTNDSLHAYTWNADARPITIDSVNVTYDALGRMVEQNRSGAYTQIIYAPTGQKFAVMNGQTLQKAFVPLPSGGLAVYNSSGLLYYGHTDHLGSTRLASTPSRTMYFDLAHAPFGEVYASSGSTDPAFTGQRQDTVSGLYDFPARE